MTDKEVEKALKEMQTGRPRQVLIYQHDPCIKDKAHKFEPRYDYGQALGGTIDMKGSVNDYIAVQNSGRSQTYVYDICIKCGMIIDRKANGGEK